MWSMEASIGLIDVEGHASRSKELLWLSSIFAGIIMCKTVSMNPFFVVLSSSLCLYFASEIPFYALAKFSHEMGNRIFLFPIEFCIV